MSRNLSILFLILMSVALCACKEPGAKPAASPDGAAPTVAAPTVAEPVAAPAPDAASAPAAQQRVCQKEKGCPPTQALPKCAPGLTLTPLAQALDNRNQIKTGTVISVEGPLNKGVGCTEMGCPDDHPCCNHCSGELFVGPVSGGPGYTRLSLVDEEDPKRFRCEGDDSLSCCPLAANGEAVVATGEFGSFEGNFGLKKVTLCVP